MRTAGLVTAVVVAALLGVGSAAFAGTPATTTGRSIHAAPPTTDFYGRPVQVLRLFLQTHVTEASPSPITPRSLYHAAGVVVDQSSTPNHVYIADSGNSRILGLRGPDSTAAELVFGQPDLHSGAANGDCNLGCYGPAGADTLCLMAYPFGTNTAEQWMYLNPDVDRAGNLYVPDIYNNRVLMYRAPFSTDKSDGKGDTIADFVWGQPDFTSNDINHGLGRDQRDARSLFISFGGFDHVASRGVSVDPAGNLWVADTFNYRVLRFPPGSATADLVLGAPDFVHSAPVPQYNAHIPNAPLDRMCTPTLARVNPETGELYVVDEYPRAFPARILVFTPPFHDGMAATRAIFPRQELNGDFTQGYRLSHATGLAFNPVKTDDWIDPVARTHTYRDGVFWLQDMGPAGAGKRTVLLDDNGKVLLAIGAPDTQTFGGRGEFWPPATGDPQQSFNVIWPGGALGFDSANNIYLADGGTSHVARFALPYRTQTIDGRTYLPYSNGGWFASDDPNDVADRVHSTRGSCLGVAAWHDQLIFRDASRYMVWNDYLKRPFGAPADAIVDYPGDGIMGRANHAIDDHDRLWTTGEHGRLMVFQLPLTAASQALRKMIPLYWADDPNAAVDYRCGQVVAYDATRGHLWISDSSHHRLLRVRNPDDYDGKLLVDAVLGQHNKLDGDTNRGMSHPDAASFGEVNDMQFDHLGNLFVADNTYELHENGRVIAFAADDLSAVDTLFPDIAARWVYVANGFDQPVGQRKFRPGQNPQSPVALAINSRNELIIGNDGYFTEPRTRLVNQLYLFRRPLEKQTPDAVVELPLGAPGEMLFDAADNLIVQDHTWNRVWVINLDRDPGWLRALPETDAAPQ